MTTKKTLLVSLCLFLSTGWLYAESQQSLAPLPSPESPESWVLRSEAVREFTAFMTKKRKELKDKYAYFPGYLEAIGKTEDYDSSSVKVPDDPKYRLQVLGLLDGFEEKNVQIPAASMTWNQVIEVAMQFVWAEGHLSAEIESGEELVRFKRILQSRERLGKKIRADAKVTVDACVRAWFYLGTINRQQGFRAYVAQEQVKENEARMKERAERSAQQRDQRKKNEQERRQNRLRYKYGYGY